MDAQRYWLQLSRYIHRNPLEANVCRSLMRYPWSSYRAYVGAEKKPDWLTTKYILKAVETRNACERYMAFVSKGIDQELHTFYDRKKIKPMPGGDAFKTELLARQPKSVDVPDLAAARVRPTLDQIIEMVCRYFNVDKDTICRQTRGKGVTSSARSVTMYLCQYAAGMRSTEIADVFGLASYASAEATIRQLKNKRRTDKALDGGINYILLDLTP